MLSYHHFVMPLTIVRFLKTNRDSLALLIDVLASVLISVGLHFRLVLIVLLPVGVNPLASDCIQVRGSSHEKN
jgi:hypothetical protein